MPELDEQQKNAFNDWLRKQQEEAARHCYVNELIERPVGIETQWVIPEHLMVATAFHEADPRPRYWVITGKVPTTHVDYSAATDARNALRRFGLHWQLQAGRVEVQHEKDREAGQAGKIDWAEKARPMAESAEIVLQVAEDDRYWGRLD